MLPINLKKIVVKQSFFLSSISDVSVPTNRICQRSRWATWSRLEPSVRSSLNSQTWMTSRQVNPNQLIRLAKPVKPIIDHTHKLFSQKDNRNKLLPRRDAISFRIFMTFNERETCVINKTTAIKMEIKSVFILS